MESLIHQIRQRIIKDGPISFAQYMDLALYAPGLGYYSGAATKFGVNGDFVTAPELTPHFGLCVVNWAEPLLRQLTVPTILEFGAGTGRLAATILQELDSRGWTLQNYLILEISADLRQRQRQLLSQCVPNLLPKVIWLDRLPERPLEGVIIANEVLDAMPVHCFEMHAGELQELCVGIDGDKFVWHKSAIQEPRLSAAIEHVMAQHDQVGTSTYRSEINMLIHPWISAIADIWTRGAMLCIDYGYGRTDYYHPSRKDGTLICHYRHRAHADPLILTGEQDITASVDFTAVAEAASTNELEVCEFTTFATFLLQNGLADMLEAAAQRDVHSYSDLAAAARKLLMPGEMGESFKAMTLAKGVKRENLAPNRHDLRYQL